METLNIIIFYLISIVSIVSTVGIICNKDASHYLSSALVACLSIGGIYFTLNAPFNAIIQCLISIFLLIFLFNCALFLPIEKEKISFQKIFTPQNIIALTFIILFFVMLSISLLTNYQEQISSSITVLTQLNRSFSTIKTLGENLALYHILEIIFIGLILLIITIGLKFNIKTSEKGDN